MYLQSPGGTRSTLLHNRPQVACQFSSLKSLSSMSPSPSPSSSILAWLPSPQSMFYNNIFQDFSSSGFTNWAFMTTHSWGESPIGKWQVSIVIEIAIVIAIVIIIFHHHFRHRRHHRCRHHRHHPQLEIHNDAYSNWGSEAKFFRWSLKLYGTQSDPNSERPEDRAW